MSRLLKVLLSLNSLRKELGFGKFAGALQFDYHREILDNIDVKKSLVLAPHPDDEVFGMGGTIGKLSKSGCDICVVYICDGSGGVKELRTENLELRAENLTEIRKKEAEEVGKILGINKQIFLGYPDGRLSSGKHIEMKMLELIKEIKPDIIFLPSFLDNHPDHRAVNEILVNVLNASDYHGEIWCYELWTPVFPNRIIDINDVIDMKKKALALYQSQLETRGYEKAMIGLNQYRAEINNLDGFAEAFFAAKPEIYRELYIRSK